MEDLIFNHKAFKAVNGKVETYIGKVIMECGKDKNTSHEIAIGITDSAGEIEEQAFAFMNPAIARKVGISLIEAADKFKTTETPDERAIILSEHNYIRLANILSVLWHNEAFSKEVITDIIGVAQRLTEQPIEGYVQSVKDLLSLASGLLEIWDNRIEMKLYVSENYDGGERISETPF